MNLWKPFAIVAALSLSANAFAWQSEGVYKITERQACDDENIDTVVLLTDQDGATKAMLSSNEYGIVYQSHSVTVGSDGSLSGMSLPGSGSNAATFTASISEDGQTMTGSVDTVVCPAAWTFTAQRAEMPVAGAMDQLDRQPALVDFVGSFSAQTDRLEGVLRFIRLGDVIAGGFGNETSGRILDFYDPSLNLSERTLDLFSPDADGNVRVKWHLNFGQVDGVMAMQGYGLSSTGRIYPVSAKKL